MAAKPMQRLPSGRGARLASGAGATAPCAACCGKVNYLQGRSCADGELAEVYMFAVDVPDGQCRVGRVESGTEPPAGCYEFRWDSPGFAALPEGGTVLGPIGFACCGCSSDAQESPCLFANNTIPWEPDGQTCCCGRAGGGELELDSVSQDCRWRITAYSYDEDFHGTTFPFFTTHDTYTLTAGVPSAWLQVGESGTISVRKSHATGGSPVITDTDRTFQLVCGGSPIEETGGDFWGWPKGQFGSLGDIVPWGHAGLPAGDRLGCMEGGTYAYTGRVTGATSYIDYVISFTFEVECDAESFPCVGCDGVGGTEGGVEDLLP